MPEKLIRCKGPNCPEIKRDTNHWFVVSPEDRSYFLCIPFDPKKPERKGWRTVCGQGCVAKLTSVWMTGTRDKSKEDLRSDQQELFDIVQDLDSEGKQ